MKQTKKIRLLASRLAKFGHVVPAALVVSFSALSFSALAADAETVVDASAADAAEFLTFLNDPTGGGDALNAAYLSSRDSTKGLLSADFLKGLDGDLFVEAKFNNKSRAFNNQLELSANGKQAAILTASSKGLVIGTNLTSLSTNGTNKLVIGGFGGFARVDFPIALVPAEASEPAKEERAASTVQAEAKGFGAGLFFAFQSDANAKTGLFADGAVSYDKFDHSFGLFNAGVAEAKDASGTIIKPAVAEGFNKTIGFAAKTLRGKLAVAYVAQLPEVGGFALFATPNAKFEFSRQIGLGAIVGNDTKSEPALVKDLQAGLKLSTVLLDGALEPFIAADFLKSDGFKDAANSLLVEKEKSANKLSAGLNYKPADNFVLNAEVGSTSAFEEATEDQGDDASESEQDSARNLSGKFGLAYLF